MIFERHNLTFLKRSHENVKKISNVKSWLSDVKTCIFLNYSKSIQRLIFQKEFGVTTSPLESCKNADR